MGIMELKQKYEKALRSVTQLSMVQKRLFAENAESMTKALEGISTLEKIKLETEGQLQDLPPSAQLSHVRKLTKVYFLTDLTAQRSYFGSSILPLREICQGDPLLAKEYERAQVFVLSNAVEHFLEALQSSYESVRRTKKPIKRHCHRSKYYQLISMSSLVSSLREKPRSLCLQARGRRGASALNQ